MKCIKYRIGNLIADLVGMAFGNGFAGEKVGCAWHWKNSPWQTPMEPLRRSLSCSAGEYGSRAGMQYQPDRVLRDCRTCLRLLLAAISSTKSTMRRLSLGSLMRVKALVSESPSEVARKSET